MSIECQVCGHWYSRKNPRQHYLSERHRLAALRVDVYCSLACRWRSHGPLMPMPPHADADKLDADQRARLVVRINATNALCTVCGARTVPPLPLPTAIDHSAEQQQRGK